MGFDVSFITGVVTASVVAGIGVSKYLGVRNNNGSTPLSSKDANVLYQRKDVCNERFNSLSDWMKRIDSKLDQILKSN